MLAGNEPIKTRDGDTKEDRLQEARERAANAYEGWRHNFTAAREDVEFLYVDQWPESVRKEREDEQRPCLTLNKLPQFLDQVVGDQRQNRPAIQVHPVQANAGPANAEPGKIPNVAGNQDYSLAEVYEAVIRNIEYTSKAETHYDRAFQHGAEAGFGWLRVLTKYASDDSFEQDIFIKSIHNRFAVLMDPDCTEPDFSDANYCFISEEMPRKEFQRRYPGKAVGDIADTERTDYSWWVTRDTVKVAEYFYREPVTRQLLMLSDGRVVWQDEVKPVLDELRAAGVTVTRQRHVKTYKVKWMKLTAYDVLESERDWPGSTIPVVPVLGKEAVLGDKTFYRGLFRFAKDAQRMHNFWMTAATERVALAPKAPYVAPAESIEGYEEEWESANRSNRGVLRYNALPGVDRPTREQPASMPAAEMQLALSASDEIKATVGMYDPSLGERSNETSGKAILARQRQGDRGTFVFSDNLSMAIARVGQICVEIIPKVIDTERVLRMRFEDGTGDWVKVNQMVKDEQSGEYIMVHDVAAGKFDVTVKAGPSYQTQRMESADSMVQFVQAVPAAGAVMMDLIAKNMDWPGSQEIARRLKKVLPQGVLDPDEMEEEGIEPPQPTPEQQLAMKELEVKGLEIEADREKAAADMAHAEADKKEAEAKIQEANLRLAEIEYNAEVAGPGTLEETVRNLVAEAIAEIEAARATA